MKATQEALQEGFLDDGAGWVFAFGEGYESASRDLEQGTNDLPCGCVQVVSTGEVIFGPVDCKEHGDE